MVCNCLSQGCPLVILCQHHGHKQRKTLWRPLSGLLGLSSGSFLHFFLCGIGIEPRASHMPGKCSTEQHPELFLLFLILRLGLAKLPGLTLNLLCNTHRFDWWSSCLILQVAGIIGQSHQTHLWFCCNHTLSFELLIRLDPGSFRMATQDLFLTQPSRINPFFPCSVGIGLSFPHQCHLSLLLSSHIFWTVLDYMTLIAAVLAAHPLALWLTLPCGHWGFGAWG